VGTGTVAEVKPTKARFFLRTAMGLYRDMQQQNSGLSAAQVREIKNAVGPTLFVRLRLPNVG
jgi:hypothetical protein